MDTTVGPWTVPDGDPVLDNAQAALPLLRPAVIDLYRPGQITLQSTHRPAGTPSWAWGYTPGSSMCWVAEAHPYVIEEYVCNHELGHPFDVLFMTPADRLEVMRHMGLTLPDGLNGKQINARWRAGTYTAKLCTVPREGFADAFAKAQAQAPNAPLDPKTGGFRAVLPNFYKTNISDYTWFLAFLKKLT